MTRRRFDHRRVEKNEMRRLRLAKSGPQMQGPAYRDSLSEMLNIRMDDGRQAVATAIVEARYDRAITRDCRFGRCTEQYDPKTRRVLASFGPAGCPCAD